MLLLLLLLSCMTCVLMVHFAGALFIGTITGDVSITSACTFTRNKSNFGGGGKFR